MKIKKFEEINEKVSTKDKSDDIDNETLNKKAEKYTSKVLGYNKQRYPSDEWDWIEKAFKDGYKECQKDCKNK